MPKHLPAGLTQYVLNTFPINPIRITSLKTTFRLPFKETKWRRSPATSRSGGEVESRRCCARRIGRDSPNFPGSRKCTYNSLAPTFFCYWAGTPDQHRQTKRLYRRMLIGAAQRELSRNNGERFSVARLRLRPTRGVVSPLPRHRVPKGAHVQYKGDDGLRWLGKISASTTEDGVYLVHFSDDPGPIKLPLPPVRYTTSTGAVRGSWCLQVHVASAYPRGIQRNVDESRGVVVVS